MITHTELPRDLSVVQTSAILGLTAPSIYKLINRGVLASYKAGNARRITSESVEALRSGKAN
ncbi:MAG: helix-turn-helix domain-containing protein [Candidatus Thiodiazotropha lotti]|nr:helix-turn-helix domain-containing protein [Candidatus Thiodiazotropha lotti]